MISPETIKDKLHHYIDFAKDEKLQAIYTLVENEISLNDENEILSWEIELGKMELKNVATNNTTLINWNEVKSQIKF